MSKPLSFYVIDEFISVDKYCKRKGMKPYKYEDKICYCSDINVEDQTFKDAVQYTYKGYIYDVLEGDQFHSDYMVILMRLPTLSYEELLNTALTSKFLDERAGAIGIILKEYQKEFKENLLTIKNGDFKSFGEKRNIKRMVKYIYNFIDDTNYIEELESIMNLCGEIKWRN